MKLLSHNFEETFNVKKYDLEEFLIQVVILITGSTM